MQTEEILQEITVPPRTIVIYTTKDCPVPEAAQRRRRNKKKQDRMG